MMTHDTTPDSCEGTRISLFPHFYCKRRNGLEAPQDLPGLQRFVVRREASRRCSPSGRHRRINCRCMWDGASPLVHCCGRFVVKYQKAIIWIMYRKTCNYLDYVSQNMYVGWGRTVAQSFQATQQTLRIRILNLRSRLPCLPHGRCVVFPLGPLLW